MHLRHPHRLSAVLFVGLSGAIGCFEDPLPSTNTSDEETGDGDGDPGDGDPGDGDGDGDMGDGDMGDGDMGDGDPGDGDGEADCVPEGTLCGGDCVNTDIDPMHCGDCDNACPPMTLCGEGMCKPEKYVFITASEWNGSFDLVPPDVVCDGLAGEAGFAGAWAAWNSTMAGSPLNWRTADGVWRLPQGEVVAYSREDLFDGSINVPINRNEFGGLRAPTSACNGTVEFAVWTATTAEGAFSGPDCAGWTSTDETIGRVGNASSTDQSWSLEPDCFASCLTQLPIYCFQL